MGKKEQIIEKIMPVVHNNAPAPEVYLSGSRAGDRAKMDDALILIDKEQRNSAANRLYDAAYCTAQPLNPEGT